MAHRPVHENRIGAEQLKSLLDKGKGDPDFRNRLLTSPDITLKAEGLKADAHWVAFFKTIRSSDFEASMEAQIGIVTAEGEGKA